MRRVKSAVVKDRAVYPTRAPRLAFNDQVTMRGTPYLVKSLQPDGEGFLQVQLVETT